MVPARVGTAVETELKNTGGVFLRLTPLGSRQVVWGTWLSGMVQILFLALLAVPLVWLRLSAFHGGALLDQVWGYAAGLVTLVAMGGVLVAVAQATAGQPMLLRAPGLFIASLCGAGEAETMATSFRIAVDAGNVAALVLVLMMCAIMVPTLLEEARRPFAHPAENCTASVRQYSLLAFLIYVAGLALGMYWAAYIWPVVFVVLMAVWGMLQPEFPGLPALPRQGWLPGCLQGRGLWGGALWLSCVCFICMLAMLPLVWLQLREHEDLRLLVLQDRGFGVQTIALLGVRYWLSLLVCLLAALLVSSLISRRFRAVVFALLLLAEFFFGVVSNIVSVISGQANLWAYLPLLPSDLMDLDLYLSHNRWNTALVEGAVLGIIAVKAVWLAVLLPLFRFMDRRR